MKPYDAISGAVVMPGKQALMRAWWLMLLALCLLSWTHLVQAAPAGTVLYADGGVRALASDGKPRLLRKGDAIEVGDTVETASNARVQLLMSDGAQFSLQPDTQFRVQEYRFSGKTDGSDKGMFSLLKGGLRTITGAIGRINKTDYEVRTPVASIGIRGTEYLARLDNGLTVSVGEGVVSLFNQAGTLDLSAGQSGFVASPNIAPVRIERKPLLVARSEPDPEGLVLPRFSSDETRNAEGYAVNLNYSSSSHSSVPGTTSGAVSSTLAPATSAYGLVYGFATNDGSHYGVDTRTPVTATLGATGTLDAYVYSTDESPSRNTLQVAELGGNSLVTWGRWNGGTTSGSYYPSSFPSGLTFNGNQGFHYVMGDATLAANVPVSGGATMSLIGSTKPTIADGSLSPGTMTGSLHVSWGGSTGTKVGADLTITMPGDATYNLVTTGGTGTPSSSQITSYSAGSYAGFSGSNIVVNGTGVTCTGSCSNGQVGGTFFGGIGSTVGLAYQFGVDGKRISGAGVFQQ